MHAQGAVLELRRHYLPTTRAKPGPPAAAEDGGTAVLQLLGAAGAVSGRAGACQAAFLGAVGQLRGVVEAAAAAAAPLDAVTLRLQASQVACTLLLAPSSVLVWWRKAWLQQRSHGHLVSCTLHAFTTAPCSNTR